MIKDTKYKKTISRTRIKEPDSSIFQMYRNTRIDPHTFDFTSNLNSSLLHRYPVIDEFKEQYSSYLGVKPENILLTSGIDGAIRSVFELYGQNTTVALLEPTYAMYRVYASAYGAEVISILPNSESFLVNEDTVLSACKKAKIVFIPNPNAPIENVFDRNALERMANLSDKEGFLLFIDEAYYGFGAPTGIELTKNHENVLVARSFSKWFGLPSIRLGCIVGNAKKLLEFETFRLAYETNSLSMSIAAEALKNVEYFQGYADEIEKSRQIIKKKMAHLGVKTHGHLSNNILINSSMGSELEKSGILVRQSIPNPAEGWMSVTLGSTQAAEIFTRKFEELFNSER